MNRRLAVLLIASLAGLYTLEAPQTLAAPATYDLSSTGAHASGDVQLRWSLYGVPNAAGRQALQDLVDQYNKTPANLPGTHPDRMGLRTESDPQYLVQIEIRESAEARDKTGAGVGRGKSVLFGAFAVQFVNDPSRPVFLIVPSTISSASATFERSIQMGGAGGNGYRKIEYRTEGPTGRCSFGLEFLAEKETNVESQFPDANVYLSQELGVLSVGGRTLDVRLPTNNTLLLTAVRRQYGEDIDPGDVSRFKVDCELTDPIANTLVNNTAWTKIRERVISGRVNLCVRGSTCP
jgi:hypothetical protein